MVPESMVLARVWKAYFQWVERGIEQFMDERLSIQSFFGSVTDGFLKGFTSRSTVSCIDFTCKALALELRRGQTLRFSASAMVPGGLVGGAFLATLRGATYSIRVHAVDDVTKAMVAGGLVGAISEIPKYLCEKLVHATKADPKFTGQVG